MIRPAAFDLDGTIVRDRTCVQSIARAIGREEECLAFERLDMRDVPAVSSVREAMAEWFRPYTREELTADVSDLRLTPGSAAGHRRIDVAGVVHLPGASLLNVAERALAEP